VRHLPFLAVLLFASTASAHFDFGLRLERLTTDEPLQFTCDTPCDVESDPTCVGNPNINQCEDTSLDKPHQGWGFGGLVGMGTGGRNWAAGVRLGGTVGYYSPVDDPKATDTGAQPQTRDVVLAHVSFEIPLEVSFGGRGGQGFLQAVPRVGVLNYVEGRDEDADTFTAGVMVVAGFRFGGGGGKIGLDAGPVLHPSFGGWLVEGTYRAGIEEPEQEVRSEPPRKKAPPRKNIRKPVNKKPKPKPKGKPRD
jgi:hypothetical protein